MARTKHSTRRNQTITLRATRRHLDVIDRAARTLGKSRAAFLLEVACREAEDVLLDRRFFQLDPAAFARFQALLANPPPPTDRLRDLMNSKAPWE